jgi:hypothetical protein
VITIQSTATLVQASGIDIFTIQGQIGGPSNSNTLVQIGAPDSLTHIVTSGGFSSSNEVIQFGGTSQTGDIILESAIEIATDHQFITYLPELSRGATLFGVIGSSGTIEQFFDRSPFFYTPSETDPNTLRDISEAQQFLLFSSTAVFGEESVRNTPSTTTLISVKGDTFDDFVSQPRNLVTNGSFEQGISSWEVEKGDSADVAEARTEQPTGAGFDDLNPVSPVDGVRMLYMKSTTTANELIVKQTIGTNKLNSSQLRNLSFSVVPDALNTNRRFVFSLVFLLLGVRRHVLEYRLTGQGQPSPMPEEISFPSSQVSLSATPDIFNSYVRDVRDDIALTSFDFDEIQIWLVADTANVNATDLLIDNIALTVFDPPDHLKFTESFAHVITTHPTASGFPFTISGSDDINQVDQTGPFFDETSPASGTSLNAPDTQVQFHIKDSGSALDGGTIDIFIDELQVITAGTTVTGALWPIATKTVLAPNNIEYIFTRSEPFPQQSVVTVSGQMSDFATPPNLTDDSYTFTIIGSGSLNATISGAPDADAPVITPVDPVSGQTQVSPDTEILWTTTDNARGVDPSTIKLFLNGGLRVDGSVATDGSLTRVANAGKGFDDTYVPDGPFAFGTTVTGTIEAADNAGNPGSLTYEFTITPDDTLGIANFFLAQNESTLLTSGTELSVCVEDFTYGVNVSGTYLTINGAVPGGLATAVSGTPSSGTGPAKVTFSVLLEPLVDFRENLAVFVHAENNFPGAFPVIKEKMYVLRPGYDVTWPNRTEDQEGGPEEVLPFLQNIQVLTDVKNFAKNFGIASSFFKFLIEEQPFADLGASLEANIKVADLSATLTSLNPFFVYGKTMILEIEADDLEGNQLRFTHTFTIEPKPT